MTEFDPELVEQAARALDEHCPVIGKQRWSREELALAVLTAVAPTLIAKGAAADDDALYGWLNEATEAAYQRGRVEGARAAEAGLAEELKDALSRHNGQPCPIAEAAHAAVARIEKDGA